MLRVKVDVRWPLPSARRRPSWGLREWTFVSTVAICWHKKAKIKSAFARHIVKYYIGVVKREKQEYKHRQSRMPF